MSEQFDKPVVIVYGIKGGVGKSMVSCNLADQLVSKGYTVGLLDADVDSSNIPQMLDIKHEMIQDKETWEFFPQRVKKKLQVFSYDLVTNPGTVKAVCNTGDYFTQVIHDGLFNTKWSNIDILIIDMPAGASDEFLTVLGYLENLIGAVVVSTPNTHIDLEKALQVAEYNYIPVIGVIENMSGSVTECGEIPICPKCGKEFKPFDTSVSDNICENHGVKVIGRIPLTNDIKNGWKLNKNLTSKVFKDVIEYIDYYLKIQAGEIDE